MANTKTAKQNISLIERRTVINRDRIGRIRTFVKKVEAAIVEGNAEKAKSALLNAQPELHRGVSKGVLHKNTVARKLSRLSQRIKSLNT